MTKRFEVTKPFQVTTRRFAPCARRRASRRAARRARLRWPLMVPTRKEQKNATKTSTLRPEGDAKVTRTESARLPLGLTSAPNHGSLRHGWVDRTSSRRSVVRDLGCSFLCLCECVCVSPASPTKRRDASVPVVEVMVVRGSLVVCVSVYTPTASQPDSPRFSGHAERRAPPPHAAHLTAATSYFMNVSSERCNHRPDASIALWEGG